MDIVAKIAAATEVSAEWLATGKGPKYPPKEDVRSRCLRILQDPDLVAALPLPPPLVRLAERGKKAQSEVSGVLVASLAQVLTASGMSDAAEWLLLGRNTPRPEEARREPIAVDSKPLITWIRALKLESDWGQRLCGHRGIQAAIDSGNLDPDSPGTDGVTPLMEATRGPMGDPRLVRLLLDHGAKVSSRDTYQNTALILAVYEQTVDLEENLPCIGLLLDAGADPLDTPDGTIRANCLTFAKDRGMKRTQMLLEHCLRERAYLGLLQGN
jgi:hypothetical protein